MFLKLPMISTLRTRTHHVNVVCHHRSLSDLTVRVAMTTAQSRSSDSLCTHIRRAGELSSFRCCVNQISSVAQNFWDAQSAWQMFWKCQRLGVCRSFFATLQQAKSRNCSRTSFLKHTQMLRRLHELQPNLASSNHSFAEPSQW